LRTRRRGRREAGRCAGRRAIGARIRIGVRNIRVTALVSTRVHGADAKAVRAAGKQAAIVETGHRGDEHLRKGGAQIPDTAFNTVAGYPDIVRRSRPTEIDLRRGGNACRKSGGS
jgi:hypothetical protein